MVLYLINKDLCDFIFLKRLIYGVYGGTTDAYNKANTPISWKSCNVVNLVSTLKTV